MYVKFFYTGALLPISKKMREDIESTLIFWCILKIMIYIFMLV